MATPQWYDKAQVDAKIADLTSQINAHQSISETALISVRRQSNGAYTSTAALQPDTTLWWIGSVPPDSTNTALKDGDLFSLVDGSA
jgi:hypothetical protein